MAEVSIFYKEMFPCNRKPGHSKCASKYTKNKCPAGDGCCVSRQSTEKTFWPVMFFQAKEKSLTT